VINLMTSPILLGGCRELRHARISLLRLLHASLANLVLHSPDAQFR
jgi:hypothetical protein